MQPEINSVETGDLTKLERITQEILIQTLLHAVMEKSEGITWKTHDQKIHFTDRPDHELLPIELPIEGNIKTHFLEDLTQEVKMLASVADGTPCARRFLLRIGEHQVTVHVEETMTLRLEGSAAASTAARDTLTRHLEKSENYDILVDWEGRIIGRVPTGTPAGRARFIRPQTAAVLIFIVASVAIIAYLLWILTG